MAHYGSCFATKPCSSLTAVSVYSFESKLCSSVALTIKEAELSPPPEHRVRKALLGAFPNKQS